ncbi:MAG: plasmid pRiA4b ORF-3 family protein, partial [Spirochaetaceae bacterium]|nr:plasmid pRiA4b ORF-3 family protein [Spirochaetaceae bacterium]
RRFGRLQGEIANLFNIRRIAFPVKDNKWLSRRGLFCNARFVITPTRSELLNGILIPGHRCVPFANPVIPPQNYKFLWNDTAVGMSQTEGSPEEFYPFFSIYGEEYAPQYIAQESQENELAYGADPFEDPVEVSIKSLDMRNIYREESFVPGDSFIVTIQDWKACVFKLERAAADAWKKKSLKEWMDTAEDAFFQSFSNLGPGSTTDEQIAWAYFYGGKRMMDVPAYSLEDFLYEKTDKFSVTAFGLETRFWYAGKEIPDYRSLQGVKTQSDETPVERLLLQHNIPVSEYVVQSYIRDAIYRSEDDAQRILERIAPLSCGMDKWDAEYLLAYISDTIKELRRFYSVFTDQKAGPVRQEVCELHTAVIDLACRLGREGIDYSILPKHTFIILSQIQIYTSNILEDLDVEEEPDESELSAIDSSIEDMIEIFDEIKEMIDKSRDAFRQTNLTLVRDDDDARAWRTVQISIGGTDVWRRLILPQSYTLSDLHRVILKLFSWSGLQPHRFTLDYISGGDMFDGEKSVKENVTIKELAAHYLNEINYEYGTRWTVKIIFSPCNDTNIEKPLCVAGENSPPPERVEGPLRFRRFISALEINDETEKKIAQNELGRNFDPYAFDINECNKRLDEFVS